MGINNKGCTNRVPVFTAEHWVHLAAGRGLDPSTQYLRARKDIPEGSLLTLFGGVTLQARTQPGAFELFTRIHAHQHDTEGEEKFQYSVRVGSEEPDSSAAWLIPKNDYPLLNRLLSRRTRATKMVKELNDAIEEKQKFDNVTKSGSGFFN